MPKIKILTDSASDISQFQAEKYDISLINFHLVLGEDSFRENEKYNIDEFYKLLDDSPEMPHTSQITVDDYLENYEREFSAGVTDLIVVTIASIGSNSHNNAVMAKEEFSQKYSDSSECMNITVIDSKSYTAGYGLPIIEATKKIAYGACAQEIITFLEDWFNSAVIVCTAFTLKYARKSGRVGCAAAFVGDVLGLKPLIVFIDAVSKTVSKIRGERAVIPAVVDYAVNSMIPKTPYAVLDGSREDLTEELILEMTKKAGYPPTEVMKVGATISCHLGHEVSGVIIKGQNRSK